MDAKARQQALRLLSNGIYILTTRSGDAYAAAMVSWVTQVSFKPPRILIALQPDSRIHTLLQKSRRGILHILAHDQLPIARTFLHATEYSEAHLNGEPFTEDAQGLPVLSRVSSYVECALQSTLPESGDHALLLMDIVQASHNGDLRPLLVADSPWTYGG